MRPVFPSPLSPTALIVFLLVLYSCGIDEDQAPESPAAPVSKQSYPTAQKADISAGTEAAGSTHLVVLKDTFGFLFRLNILNRNGNYTIYEGESIDPEGNQYEAAGIYDRIDGDLSISSFLPGNVPYHSNLNSASDTTYGGYEQLVGKPWEHYRNTYQVVEGRLE
jgi:hypothetical protein